LLISVPILWQTTAFIHKYKARSCRGLQSSIIQMVGL